jgi:hypothetical protein
MWPVIQSSSLREAPATLQKNITKEENSFCLSAIKIGERGPQVEIAIARVSKIVWQDR